MVAPCSAIHNFVARLYRIPPKEFIMFLSDPQKARAEAAFKRKEDQARDGATAWAEYEAKSRAVAKNMERLRALRLAKEAAATAHPSPNPFNQAPRNQAPLLQAQQ